MTSHSAKNPRTNFITRIKKIWEAEKKSQKKGQIYVFYGRRRHNQGALFVEAVMAAAAAAAAAAAGREKNLENEKIKIKEIKNIITTQASKKYSRCIFKGKRHNKK